MKKFLFRFLVISMLVSSLAIVASAGDTGTAFRGDITNSIYPGSTYSDVLVLSPSVTYNIWYSVNAAVQYSRADGGSAVLSSKSASGAIWQILTQDKDTGAWSVYANLIPGSLTARNRVPSLPPAGIAPIAGFDISGYSGIKIGYDLQLVRTGTGTATCSGDGVLKVTAVPEPGTMLSLLTFVAPAGFLLQRRK